MANRSGYEYMLRLYGLESGRRQVSEQKMPPFLLELMKRCLVLATEDRPGFGQVVAFCEEFLATGQLSYKKEFTAETGNESFWLLVLLFASGHFIGIKNFFVPIIGAT